MAENQEDFSGQALPWDHEQKESYIKAYWQSFVMSIVDHRQFFRLLELRQSVWPALMYALIASTLALLVLQAFSLGFGVGFSFLPDQEWFSRFTLVGSLLFLPFWIAGFAFITAAGLLFNAAIFHFCLMLFGGTSKNFETTFRIVCYSQGAQLFNIVPGIGTIVAGFLSVFLLIKGAKLVHDTSWIKCIFAFLLPILLCFGFIMFITVVVLGGIFAAGNFMSIT